MIGLNINKDFNPFINGDKYKLKDVQVIEHAIEERLQILKGELAYNINIGVPLGFNKDSVDLAILDIVKSTYGVVSAFFVGESILQNGRFYKATLKVNTIYNKTFEINI